MRRFTGTTRNLPSHTRVTLEQHISRRVNIAPQEADLHPSSTPTATDARLARATADRSGSPADQLSNPGAVPGLVARSSKQAPSLYGRPGRESHDDDHRDVEEYERTSARAARRGRLSRRSL